MNEIGQYIKKLRKGKGLTQTQLADKLNISFQSVSKWEVGETLPDTNILLALCDELDTTVDTLLNGGIIENKRRKVIKVESIVDGFKHLAIVKDSFGEESYFYQGVVEGISAKMNFNFEDTLKENPEVLYTEVLLGYLSRGYSVDIEEAKRWIHKNKYIEEIKKRM
ncbi:MAG: helix-turn-helix transcriptional regulator [Clostridia bacterium]|nr:helix-turn-helix transcriptional regulator [Clostridia bacterium]